MILYMKDTKTSIGEHLETRNDFRKVVGYKTTYKNQHPFYIATNTLRKRFRIHPHL